MFLFNLEGILQEESFLIKDNLKNVTFESVIVSKIMECIDKLIERGLGFVACQKIIHPAVKQHLARKVSSVTIIWSR